ncbi:transcription-repair coupling factor [Tindallia californiensis]|uniref:Transcription-repair-coupling factor n=1 Tax=Tindallia californiensis TaxID=159292 RepID=A0A1H3PGB1_9FIRM|nr:transcription-repair coupling factor [Tindallia californiensis]SDZ00117.1 transcription-repair coupling factor [Tindallia californiensis]
MNGKSTLLPLKESREFQQLMETMNRKDQTIGLYGLLDGQKAHLTAGIFAEQKKQIVIITETETQAREMMEDLRFFAPVDPLFFPSREWALTDAVNMGTFQAEDRLKTLATLCRKSPVIVTTSMEALMIKLPPPELFAQLQIQLTLGEETCLQTLVETLYHQGYQRKDQVEEKGDFSLRGDIIDIFPPMEEQPIRVELFDEEIDSLRRFDPVTQQSVEKIQQIQLSPSTEWLAQQEHRERLTHYLQEELEQLARKKTGKTELRQKMAQTLEKWEHHWSGKEIEGFQTTVYQKTYSLLDYLQKDAILVLDEPLRLKTAAETTLDKWKERYAALLEEGNMLPQRSQCLMEATELNKKFQKYSLITMDLLPRNETLFLPESVVNFTTRGIPSFQGKISYLLEEVNRLLRKECRIILLTPSKEKALKLLESFREAALPVQYLVKDIESLKDMPPGVVSIIQGSIHKGFEYVNAGLHIMSDLELFGAPKKKKPKRSRSEGRSLQSFVELKPGGYVVHENHGIGQYLGIESLTVDGITKDYLKIGYAGADHLYVPTDQMDMIQKYIGNEDRAPKMNRMGGTEWTRTKAKVQKAIEDMADELLELYAKRKKQKGYAFGKDTEMQEQFEYLFPYEETPDQLKSINEVKADMESERPMDRLLCGDVGYGKTEVALRAVFKAVADSKQAAVLVPTTILAQQHFNTFQERFGPFPIRVEMLSRFRTAAQQRQLLKDLKKGIVDVVVGTHRLLSQDVQFKDLGLLVVDEEQRFGVKHKERLKRLKAQVDVLTLSATPIPRTLHMAMVGIRDMSVIEDPPEERFPVQTYVVPHNPSLVADAIEREMSRGGQAYYVYNRVEGIHSVAAGLARRFPHLRIGVGHGQMNENELEKLMLDYYEGSYDILVCTTIIENGLDIPNVNTIIIQNADQLGLSQLYQLRGRVGRSNRQGYAYLMVEKGKLLSGVAEKRLKAIKEFTEFGAGFKIAMRDLEIRGAGNLLGGEQHGHMAAIGYDLYVKLLEEAIQKTRGETVEKDLEVSIELNVDAYLPEKYIQNPGHKVEIYKKIAAIRCKEDWVEVETEIEDRFGDIPIIVRNLLLISYIKAMAMKAGFDSILQKEKRIKLQLAIGKPIDPESVARVMHEFSQQVDFNAGTQPHFLYKPGKQEQHSLLQEIKVFMERYTSSPEKG